MKLLVATPYLPAAGASHGGGRLLHDTLVHLAPRHRITLLTLSTEPDDAPAVRHLREICEEVRVIQHDVYHLPRATRLANLFSRTPSWFLHARSAEMREALVEAVERTAPDVVQLAFLPMAPYAAALRHPALVLDLYEALGRDGPWRIWRGGSGWRRPYLAWDLARVVRAEAEVLDHFAMVLTVSEEDRAFLAAHAPAARVRRWIPGTRPAPLLAPDPPRDPASRLLFVGAFEHGPNVDAVVFFVREVLPRIVAQRPDVVLDVVGPGPPREVQRLASPNVRIRGWVDDLDAAYHDADLAVVPVRLGGGLRTKVLEAMARGVPTVTTTRGAEGIEGRAGVHLRCADEPAAFAEQVLELLADPVGRLAMGLAGRALTEGGHGWPAAVAGLEALYRELSGPG